MARLTPAVNLTLNDRRLATPGALLMVAGAALLYWGLGIVRGETGGITKRFTDIGDFGKNPPTIDNTTGTHGGGDTRLQ